MVVHSGKKPFKCDICGRTVTRKFESSGRIIIQLLNKTQLASSMELRLKNCHRHMWILILDSVGMYVARLLAVKPHCSLHLIHTSEKPVVCNMWEDIYYTSR
jgi:hypothetical protein